MSGFLLDTNCVTELVRSNPEPRVLEWMEAADESLLYLSVLTLGEIRKGVAGLPQGKCRTHLDTELDLQARFSGRILSIDRPVADRWGLLAAEAKRKGKRCQPSTVCWPRPRFTTILRWCRATSATSPILTLRFSILAKRDIPTPNTGAFCQQILLEF
jgi:predicted nucleic acid-binding protein